MKTLSGLQECWKLSVVRFLVLGGRTSLTVCFALAASGNYTLGQVVGDNSLDTESSQVTSPRTDTFQIDGGATRGTNLFHSFSQFSVPTGGSAYFNNTLNIQNIMTRVTGGSVSNIDGLIRANGTANLFLINPNGIIFGPNAKLNINGSFMGSTASSILFADGTEFSATDTQTTPLLTVNVPIGLQLGNNPAPVRVHRSNLEVKPNQNLVLVGGEVSLDQGKLAAPGGRIELGGLSVAGKVGLNDNGSLNFPNNVTLSDVSLTNGASMNVRAGGGGFITINARNLAVSGGSKLIAGIEKNLGLSPTQAGDVKINASNTVSLDGSKVENPVDNNALGNAGNIEITTGSLFLSNDAKLSSETRGQGNAGNVRIHASDTVSLNGSEVETEVEAGAEGNAGNIEITTNSLSLVNGAVLKTSTEGTGNAGRVIIRASDRISLDRSKILSMVETEKAVGDSGGIDITTRELSLSNEAQLIADTQGTGNAGKVIIRASDTIFLADESIISSIVDEDAVGNSGGINITTGTISLINNAGLTATTKGTGNAGSVILNAIGSISLVGDSFINSKVEKTASGNSGGIDITAGEFSLSDSTLNASTQQRGNAGQIIIRASDTIFFDKSLVTSRVENNAVGNSGGIDITTASLALVNNAGLTATTDGKGEAGSIIIRASNIISLRDGSFVNSRVADRGVGNSGGIYITTDLLSVTNNSELNVSSFGQGNPGNLVIKADSIQLENQGKLTAQTKESEGGNIVLQVEDILLLRDKSLISAQASGDALGGNIDIDAGFVIALPNQNNDIIASAQRGNGGNINITTEAIVGLEERSSTPRNSTNDIDASSEFGLNGNVSINTPDVDPSQGLVNLPVEPINVEVAQDCQARGKQASIGFFNTGRGGLAPNPYEPISSSNIWEDVPSSTQETEFSARAVPVSTAPANPSDKIIEAQGWLINQKGEVVLVAEMPTTPTQSRCRLR